MKYLSLTAALVCVGLAINYSIEGHFVSGSVEMLFAAANFYWWENLSKRGKK